MNFSHYFSVGLRFCFGEASLSLSKGLLLVFEKSGLINLSPIRALDVGDESKVNSNDPIGFRKRLRAFCFTGEVDKPFVGWSSFNRTGLDCSKDRSVKNNIDHAYLGEEESLLSKLKSHLRVGYGIIPTFPFESRVSRILSCFASSKKGFESKVYTELGILEALREYVREFRFFRLPLGEFFLGLVEGHRFLIGFPGIFSKSKGFIVYPTSLFQDVVHLGDLGLEGI